MAKTIAVRTVVVIFWAIFAMLSYAFPLQVLMTYSSIVYVYWGWQSLTGQVAGTNIFVTFILWLVSPFLVLLILLSYSLMIFGLPPIITIAFM